jgi:hypothetical protein
MIGDERYQDYVVVEDNQTSHLLHAMQGRNEPRYRMI